MDPNTTLLQAIQNDDVEMAATFMGTATNHYECMILAIQQGKNDMLRYIIFGPHGQLSSSNISELYVTATLSLNVQAIEILRALYNFPLDVTDICLKYKVGIIHLLQRLDISICIPRERLYALIESACYKELMFIVELNILNASDIFIEISNIVAQQCEPANQAEQRLLLRYSAFLYLQIFCNTISSELLDKANHKTLSYILDAKTHFSDPNKKDIIDNASLYQHIKLLHKARQSEITTVFNSYNNDMCDHKNISNIIAAYVCYADTAYDTPQSVLYAYKASSMLTIKKETDIDVK